MKGKHINLDFLKKETGNDKTLIREIINEFISSSNNFVELSKKFINEKTPFELKRLSHTLKSGSYYMGSTKLVEFFNTLENKKLTKKNLTDTLSKTIEEINIVNSALQDFLLTL